MKSLGYLVSLLVHLLFLVLLLQVRFPLIEIPVPGRIIQVVPMSPPSAEAQPAPRPVYIRPFVLKGGARGRGRGEAGGANPAPGAGAVREVGAPSHAASVIPAPAAAKAQARPAAPGPPKLTIDWKRAAEIVREKKAPTRPAAGAEFPSKTGQRGLPFGDAASTRLVPGGASGGDGTASHALAGNAFFDSRGYDITPWAKRMVYRIKKNWIFPPVSAYGLKGMVGIYMLIERDGAVSRVFIRKTSNIRPFDQAAFNAIQLSAPLPPLPDDFPHANLPAYLLFYYN